MGAFDFFKKKEIPEATDPTTYLREELMSRLEQMGYSVSIKDGIVYADGRIGILVEMIEDADLHPFVAKVGVKIAVEDYFPGGLIEVLAGIGETLNDKVNSVLNNLFTVTLPPILDAFTDSHNPNLDFTTNIGREILWHPKLGNLGFQGKWKEHPENDFLFKLLKEWLEDKLIDRKFNWLKIYIAKQADGSITGDCSLNNEFEEDGYRILEEYAKSWETTDGFKAVKQFILFRECDAYLNKDISPL